MSLGLRPEHTHVPPRPYGEEYDAVVQTADDRGFLIPRTSIPVPWFTLRVPAMKSSEILVFTEEDSTRLPWQRKHCCQKQQENTYAITPL